MQVQLPESLYLFTQTLQLPKSKRWYQISYFYKWTDTGCRFSFCIEHICLFSGSSRGRRWIRNRRGKRGREARGTTFNCWKEKEEEEEEVSKNYVSLPWQSTVKFITMHQAYNSNLISIIILHTSALNVYVICYNSLTYYIPWS